VGERRRTVAGGPHEKTAPQPTRSTSSEITPQPITEATPNAPTPTKILLNGEEQIEAPSGADLGTHKVDSFLDAKEALASKILAQDAPVPAEEEENMEHNSGFFDPSNKRASQIREQVARETLDELLDYILVQGGSVGILDATNSTMERRKMVMDCIRERAGPQLNVLFLESRCVDKELLEANMRLKLNGPDYRNKDPAKALNDFRKRVQEYEKAYVPLGQYEEDNDMPYIQMIDVGRKVISHQIKGFLMAQANYYLLNFNLTPRQIWITRHGLSMDNVSGKIGGDSELAAEGVEYAKALTRFMDERRREWDAKQQLSQENTHFPPLPGDSTPPNPHYHLHAQDVSGRDIPDIASLDPVNPKAFCVWTSMLKRSIDTAQFFDEEEYDIKQMRMLDELNAGVMEGLTYSCISRQYPDEYVARKADKLHYRYPGPGGEGYLDIINRLRPVIVELERMTDHVLLIGHRSVARVLLAYFLGLGREVVADLDVPIGMLWCLEPKPYGVDLKAYQWQPAQQWFTEVPDFKLKRAAHDMQ
jgi:6-phosphofructo-2-kinase